MVHCLSLINTDEQSVTKLFTDYQHIITHMDPSDFIVINNKSLVCSRCLESSGTTRSTSTKLQKIDVMIKSYHTKYETLISIFTYSGYLIGTIVFTFNVHVFEKDTFDNENMDHIDGHGRGFKVHGIPNIKHIGCVFTLDKFPNLDLIKRNTLKQTVEKWKYGKIKE